MKVIDILVNRANKKEVPQKIKYGDVIWEWNGSNYEDKTKGLDSCKRFLLGKHNLNILNCKVEIIEEKPKRLDEEHNFYSYSKYNEIKHEMEKVLYILRALNRLEEKTSKLTKAVNYLLEKSDG